MTARRPRSSRSLSSSKVKPTRQRSSVPRKGSRTCAHDVDVLFRVRLGLHRSASWVRHSLPGLVPVWGMASEVFRLSPDSESHDELRNSPLLRFTSPSALDHRSVAAPVRSPPSPRARRTTTRTATFPEVRSPIAFSRREATHKRRTVQARLQAALGFLTPSATSSSRRSSRPGPESVSDAAPPERTLLGFALQSLPLSGSCATSRSRRALLTLSQPGHYLGCPGEPGLSPTPWLWDLGSA